MQVILSNPAGHAEIHRCSRSNASSLNSGDNLHSDKILAISVSSQLTGGIESQNYFSLGCNIKLCIRAWKYFIYSKCNIKALEILVTSKCKPKQLSKKTEGFCILF